MFTQNSQHQFDRSEHMNDFERHFKLKTHLKVIGTILESSEFYGEKRKELYKNVILQAIQQTKKECSIKEILKVWEVNLITCLQKGKTDGYIDRHVDSEAVASFLMSSYMGIRLLMVEGNAKLLHYKFMQQLRSYFKTIVIKK